MYDFTNDEMNLMCIYNAGSRTGLMDALIAMKQYLESDEKNLMSMTESALDKLSRMSDEDFATLELVLDFDM